MKCCHHKKKKTRYKWDFVINIDVMIGFNYIYNYRITLVNPI